MGSVLLLVLFLHFLAFSGIVLFIVKCPCHIFQVVFESKFYRSQLLRCFPQVLKNFPIFNCPVYYPQITLSVYSS